jgi:NAD-dependent DNA ligase
MHSSEQTLAGEVIAVSGFALTASKADILAKYVKTRGGLLTLDLDVTKNTILVVAGPCSSPKWNAAVLAGLPVVTSHWLQTRLLGKPASTVSPRSQRELAPPRTGSAPI